MYAEAQLSAELLKEALEKNGEAISATGDGTNLRRCRENHGPACLGYISKFPDLLPRPAASGAGARSHRRLARAPHP